MINSFSEYLMCYYCWGPEDEEDGGEAMFGLFHLISWFIIIGFIAICFVEMGR